MRESSDIEKTLFQGLGLLLCTAAFLGVMALVARYAHYISEEIYHVPNATYNVTPIVPPNKGNPDGR